jgi:hypothetical protein
VSGDGGLAGLRRRLAELRALMLRWDPTAAKPSTRPVISSDSGRSLALVRLVPHISPVTCSDFLCRRPSLCAGSAAVGRRAG